MSSESHFEQIIGDFPTSGHTNKFTCTVVSLSGVSLSCQSTNDTSFDSSHEMTHHLTAYDGIDQNSFSTELILKIFLSPMGEVPLMRTHKHLAPRTLAVLFWAHLLT